jgi:predicted RNA-binding protein YlqC (UPF0109 family)
VKQLLETFARALVSDPSRVVVHETVDEQGTLLELAVAPEDRGRVIGRKGRTADALRDLLDAVARRRGTTCDVEILDEDD